MANSKSKVRRLSWILRGVLIIGVLSISTTGCEPLRKKFVRKKKAAKVRVEPVLDPIDYPARSVSASKQYQYHFSMWQVWVRDLITSINEGDGDKRITFLFKQAMAQLDEMDAMISDDKAKLELDSYRSQWQDLIEDMTQPKAMRNDYGMVRRIQRIEKAVRTRFQSEDLGDQLIKL